MKKWILIIVAFVIGYFIVVGYQIYNVKPNDLNLIYLNSINSFDSQPQTIRFETKGDITRVEIQVYGNSLGKGTLTIGYYETDPYREYRIDSGKVDFRFQDDWNTRVCYLTYRPDEITNGQFEVSCDFTGDEE